MTRKFFYSFFFLIPIFAVAQIPQKGLVAEEIQNAKNNGQTFTKTSLFKNLSTAETASLSSRTLDIKEAVFFNFESSSDFASKARSMANFTLSVPFGQDRSAIDIDLISVDIHSDDFISNVAYQSGYHFRGTVQGANNSLVSFSVFDDQVIGFISIDGKTYTVGKVKGAGNTHILYNEFIQGWGLDLACNTDDRSITFEPADIEREAGARSPGDCIKQKFEVDESLTNQVGGEAAGIAYGTGVFNNQKTLYANDGINVVLSELKVWTNNDPAPYIIDQYNTLDSYRALTGNYNGDVAYLGFYQGGWGGGVASAIGGICQNNVDDTKAIGGHYGSYEDVPTYTHDVLIISHEMGHIFGARHTHACVWNGNNTAIDGCAGFTEGGCQVPPSINPGTIMSYCNTSDFNEGFHPQVAQAIQNYIASRTCTDPCSGEPTCSDGIQNGQETGVDCGGPDCDPCEVQPTCSDGIQNGQETGVDCGGPDCQPCEVQPTCSDGIQNGQETGVDCGGPDCQPCEVQPTCSDGIQNGQETGVDCGGPDCQPCEPTDCDLNTVVLNLTLDNYPEETSWEIINMTGEVVASSNGTYANEADGTILNINNCLADGCYKFTISDSYGDGICCGYGQGSYTLTGADGDILASGGQFAFEETTEFCVGEGGSDPEYCEAQGTDTGYEWIDRVVFGSINNQSGDNQGYADFTNISANLSPGSSVGVQLFPGFSGNSYNEYWKIWIDYNQDGDFDDADELVGQGNGSGVLSGNLAIASSAVPGNTLMRVAMQYAAAPEACGIYQYGEVEDYTVVIGSSFTDGDKIVHSQPNGIAGDGSIPTAEQINVFPNPADDEINIGFDRRVDGKLTLEIRDQLGRIVHRAEPEAIAGRNSLNLDVSQIPSGIYIIRLTGKRYRAVSKLMISK